MRPLLTTRSWPSTSNLPSISAYTFNEPVILPLLLLLGVIWLIPHTSYPEKISQHVSQTYQSIPSVKFDLNPQKTFASRYSPNKTALYIEPRSTIIYLIPLLVHMLEIVPQDWRFVFIGSDQTAAKVENSLAARKYTQDGKLLVRTLDRWTDTWSKSVEEMNIDETISRIMTNGSFYDVELAGTEHLFLFHSDAVLCANAETDLDDWLEYDWVGAPWKNVARFGGSGGLSLRRVSKVRQILNFQQRMHDTLLEDAWLSSRMGLLPDANMAPVEIQLEFSVQDVWHDRPLGYHLNPAGPHPDVWVPQDRRKAIFEYCPEIKIIMDMRLEAERCPEESERDVKESPAAPGPGIPDEDPSPMGEAGHTTTPEEYNEAMADLEEGRSDSHIDDTGRL